MTSGFAAPEEWKHTTIGDLSHNIQYGYTESAVDEPVGPKFLRISDIQDDEVDWDSTPYCEVSKDEKEKYLLREGDILFARTGGTVGKSFLIQENIPEAVFASYLIRIQLAEEVNERYVYYFFKSNDYWRQISEGKKGVGQANVNSTILSEIELPLPPQKEQERIVAKIEELFSKLDSSVSELQDTRNQLDRYRKSTLKAAMFGELTRAWRNQHSADRLPLDDQIDEYIKEVNYESDAELSGLPDQWRQVPLGSISDVIPGNSPPSDTYNDTGEGLPLINGPSEFGPNAFSKTKQTKFTTDPTKECDKDDLIVCVRGNTTGRMNIASTRSAIGRGVAAVRAYICQQFVNYYIHFKESHLLNKGTGTTYPSISSKDLRRLPIPLPTIEEQREIVDILDRRFSILDGVEPEIDDNIQRVKRLRQSILKHAFEGKLVPQDSTEEPPTPDGSDTNLEQGAQATLSEVTSDVE